MKLKLPLLAFSILYLASSYAEVGITPESLAFKKLEKSIANYSDKVVSCGALQRKNKLTDEELTLVLGSFRNHPPTLGYLSDQALTHCLQPEKGILAEMILATHNSKMQHSNNLLQKTIYELAESTKKLVFSYDFEDEYNFHKLPAAQQEKLLTIESLKKPFDELIIYEQIINAK